MFHKIIFKLLLSLFALFLCLNGFSQEEKARKIVQILCSDTLYGRGYVNDGVNKAASFLENEFRKSGLRPFFGDTSYFQKFQFAVNTFPGEMSIISDDYFFQPGVDYLVNERSGSFHGNLFLIEIDSSTFEQRELLFSEIDKIRTSSKNGFLIDLTKISPSFRREMTLKFNSLASIGVIVYLTDEKFTWSVGRKQHNFPIIYFQKEKFNKCLLSANIKSHFIPDFENKNVVGYLPSKKKNAKTIVFTAHYDHLGAMGTQPLTYFPGANDNASGTAMLISLADYFKENPSKYNLLFIAFAGEEAGLIGSNYFVENNSFDLSQIKFLINLDIMGSGEDGITVVNGNIFKKEFKKISKINQKKNYLTQVKSRGEAANSDHWFFYRAGVPSIFIYTMGENKNYHDVFDTYEALSFSAYNNILHLLVDFVRKI